MYVTDKTIHGERTTTVRHKYNPLLRTFEVSIWIGDSKDCSIMVGRKKSLSECVLRACKIAVELAYPTIF